MWLINFSLSLSLTCGTVYRIMHNSLKQYETRLDKFWRNQDVMFDWTAKITPGDRSEFKLETVLESTI